MRQQQTDAKTLLGQLRSSRTDNKEQRKQAARDKVARLKAQIQALRLMAGGDPKAVARQAARLARELSQAAREYAGASVGGSGNILNGGSENGLFAAAPADANALRAEAAAAEAEAKTTENVTLSQDTINKQVASMAEQTADAKADAEFVKDASKLLNDLKKIIEDAKRKIQLEKGVVTTPDLLRANNELSSAEKSLNGIFTGALATATSAVNLLA